MESSIEQRARIVAENASCLLLKLHHGVVGIPDRLLVCPHMPMRFIEFKRPGEEPSAIQMFWMRQLGRGGHPVVVIDSIEDFRDMVDSVNKM